jgi:small-conductance mechanosensitive channel
VKDRETVENKAEEIKQDAVIQRELQKTANAAEEAAPVAEKKRGLWVYPTYALFFIFFAVLYYLLRWQYFTVPEVYRPLIERAAIGGVTIVLVLTALSIIRGLLISRIDSAAARYNLNRVANLLAGVSVFFITLSVLFANWYTAVVSLGLISLVLGFALQTPISSFIGWIYILVKSPYKVGDRIKIGEATGDVLDVAYLDTTLWEFGGPLLSTVHHPSGRIIKFPNSQVLSSAVFNYSWPLFPYIWSDIKFQIAYQSDLEFVAQVMTEAAEEEVGEAMMDRVRVYRELLSQTAIDELEVQERPAVVFRVSSNTWIEAIVRYLVEPRRAGNVKTRLIKKILARLNAAPEKVMFPKGDLR